MPREPRPIELESCPVPTNNSFRLHKHQCSLPSRPELSQCHPEQLVDNNKTDVGTLPFQHAKLLPKRKIFQEQIAATTKGSLNQDEQEPQQAEHGASLTRKIRRNPIHFYLTD
jgi:hypothetical protein